MTDRELKALISLVTVITILAVRQWTGTRFSGQREADFNELLSKAVNQWNSTKDS